jgi:phosphoglycerol transferase MdoB-like AlkP superfamily enzyme
MAAPPGAFEDDATPTLHRQSPALVRSRPPNLVILIEESMGAQYVGSLGGLPLTPNLDRLSEQGLSFTRLYATGTRSSRGLEAIVCGFPPTPAPAVIKLSLSQENFFSLGRLLKEFGYATYFFTCGAANFENMGGFLQNNGFDHIIEEKDFENPVFRNNWGVSDEDLVTKANEVFRSQGDAPFFGMMFTTSNHSPFDYPEGRIEPYERPAHTRNNALKYADYAIGRLFELAEREAYYSNTIFMVVADHDTRLRGSELIPLEHFRIPAVIVGPGVPVRKFDGLASQIDLAPTLLGLMGLETDHPMIGRDVLALDDGDPGRSLMQYALTNAFRVGDRLVLHQPGRHGRTFRVVDDKLLEPVPPDVELTRDALAHVLWASGTYNRRLYREAQPAKTAKLIKGAVDAVPSEQAP